MSLHIEVNVLSDLRKHRLLNPCQLRAKLVDRVREVEDQLTSLLAIYPTLAAITLA